MSVTSEGVSVTSEGCKCDTELPLGTRPKQHVPHAHYAAACLVIHNYRYAHASAAAFLVLRFRKSTVSLAHLERVRFRDFLFGIFTAPPS